MNITKDTTDEEILAPIRLSREALARKLALPDSPQPEGGEFHRMSAEDLAMEANHLARLEGEAKVRSEYRNALQYGATEEAQRRMLTQILLRQPDDTYSGRLNDMRRSVLDGIRNEVAEILGGMGVRF